MKRTTFSLAISLAVASATMGTSPVAFAVDTASPKYGPDLSAAREKIKAKNWAGAIADLQALASTHQHADVFSLLGYSLRNAGDYKAALTYYKKAIDFDPVHRGAHEYLGELYVKTGEMAKAEAQVATLQKLCPQGCEELEDLRKFMATGAADAKPELKEW